MQLLEAAKPHLLTVAEYMTTTFEARTELIGGVVYDVSPKKESHSYPLQQLIKYLAPQLLGSGKAIRVQDPIAVPDWHGRNAPEIDIAIIADKSYQPMPTSADAFAFIEVSDTTYNDDRKIKVPLYVNAGVPAWIVNIEQRQAEFYGSVADLALEHGQVLGDRDAINVLRILIPVGDLFAHHPKI